MIIMLIITTRNTTTGNIVTAFLIMIERRVFS
jgi:hypothetical protein